MKPKHLICIVLLAVALSACSQNVDMTFFADQTWQLETTLTADMLIPEILAEIAGEEIEEGLGFPIPEQILDINTYLDMGMNTLAVRYRDLGIQADYSRAGDRYTLETRGTQYSQFPELMPGLITLTKVEDNEDQYHLNIQIGEWNVYVTPVFQQTITLHVGEIFSCNTSERSGNTATWRNPAEIDVTFTPKSTISLSWLWIPFGILAIGVAGILLVSARGKVCPECGMHVSRGTDYCPNCNSVISAPRRRKDRDLDIPPDD